MKKAIPQKWNENVLLVSDDGRYTENAKKMGVNVTGWTWNSKFADLDNDEWQDLYVANGILRRHMVPNNFFFHNEQGKKFTPATDAYGLGNYMSIPSFSYLDFDRDGDLDIAMNTVNGPLFFYRNNTRNNESIVFEIRDFSGNHFGIGTRIVVNYGDGRHQLRELKSGGGFVSFDAPLLHFGLGNHGEVDDIQVTWSTGEISDLAGPFPAGQVYRIVRRK